MSSHEITFYTNLSEPTSTRADFTYKITPTVISIVGTGLGRRSVTEDIEAVLRQIEYWHQGSIATLKIMCRDGKDASLSPLGETDEQKARKKLLAST
jgi:hypothetical protein